jgi:hypothetical protein
LALCNRIEPVDFPLIPESNEGPPFFVDHDEGRIKVAAGIAAPVEDSRCPA